MPFEYYRSRPAPNFRSHHFPAVPAPRYLPANIGSRREGSGLGERLLSRLRARLESRRILRGANSKSLRYENFTSFAIFSRGIDVRRPEPRPAVEIGRASCRER